MSVRELLKFLLGELKRALVRSDAARISDIATTVEVLNEFSTENNDETAVKILKDFDYIVLHYDEEPQYVDNYLERIGRALEDVI